LGKFIIKLKDTHEETGLTSYAVARDTGLNNATVRKYTTENVLTERIYNYIKTLCDYYGVDWRDPNIIDWVSDEEADSPETKTPLAAAVS